MRRVLARSRRGIRSLTKQEFIYAMGIFIQFLLHNEIQSVALWN